MTETNLMTQIESRQAPKDELPEFEIGDTVDVQVRISEGE